MNKEDFKEKYKTACIRITSKHSDFINHRVEMELDFDKKIDCVRSIALEMLGGYIIENPLVSDNHSAMMGRHIVTMLVYDPSIMPKEKFENFEYEGFVNDWRECKDTLTMNQDTKVKDLLAELLVVDFKEIKAYQFLSPNPFETNQSGNWIQGSVNNKAAYFWAPEKEFGILVTKDFGYFLIYF